MGEVEDLGLYAFARNDPVLHVDPRGLAAASTKCKVKITGQIDITLSGLPASLATKVPGSNAQIIWQPGKSTKSLACCQEAKFSQIASSLYIKVNGKEAFASKPSWHADSGDTYYHIRGEDDTWITGEPLEDMGDTPGGKDWKIKIVVQKFETCVVCTKGADKGKVFGCVKWGHKLGWMPTKIPVPEGVYRNWSFTRWATIGGKTSSAKAIVREGRSQVSSGTGAPQAKLSYMAGAPPSAKWRSIMCPRL